MAWFSKTLNAKHLDQLLQRLADGLPLSAEQAAFSWPRPLDERIPQLSCQLNRYRIALETLADHERELPAALDFTTGFTGIAAAINELIGREAKRRAEEEDLNRWMDAISNGDYSARLNVEMALNIDLLQKFNRVAERLAKLDHEQQLRDRYNQATEDLAADLRGDFDEAELGKRLLARVSKVCGADTGAFYRRCEQGEYERIAGYALSQRHQMSHRFKPGEGLLGRAVEEQALVVLDKVPADYLPMESALIQGASRQLLLWPIVYLGEVIAAVELASFNTFTAEDIQWLERQTESVGITLSMATARQTMTQLLKDSEQKNEELRAQQEELRAQSEELRAQGDAMQQLNADLEEKNEALSRFQAELEEKNELLQRQQAELEQHNQELEQQKQALKEKQRAVERASRYKSEFLANMSHELRTPLNSLLLLSSDLLENSEGNLTEEQLESIEMIKKGGSDLLNLINDILDLSKIEAGQLRVIREPVDLASQCKELVALLRPLAEQKNLALKLNVHPELPDAIYSDGQRIAQILKNLLSNAIKFTEQGEVSVEIAPVTEDQAKQASWNSGVIIKVRDTGPGIAKDRIDEVFEAFQQGDGSITRKHGGTGLGLSISRQLARRLGGELMLESELGKGSCFSLLLPVDGLKDGEKVDEVKVESASTAARQSSGSDASRPLANVQALPLPDDNPYQDDRDQCQPGDCSILIIEDDASFAKTLMKQMRKKQFKVLASPKGQDGLALAQHFRPVGIVLDLGLPDMDGRDVVAALKNHPVTESIPIHVVSARDYDPGLLRLGVVDYLQKPVSQSALQELISNLDGVRGTPTRRLLVVEDHEITQKTLQKLLGRQELEVTTVTTGEEALRQLEQQTFDGMILDLGLPDMTGRELLEHMQEKGLELPVIVYTGGELSEQEYRALREHTENIVLKGSEGKKRLEDEVSLFLHGLSARIKHSSPQESAAVSHKAIDADTSLEGKKVLLVDDDVRNAFALNKVLRKQGLSVVIANDGQLALEKLEQNPDVDLVLMDIMMPVMDGYQSMQHIRKMPQYEKLPIIALTAKAMAEDRQKCLDAGANDYLAKPIDLDKLLSLMRLYLKE